jgi:hypothetical protein
MAEDALSNLLKTVRLTGATFFDIEAQDPWAVRSPAPPSILPRILPGADHLISYPVAAWEPASQINGLIFRRGLCRHCVCNWYGGEAVGKKGRPASKQDGPLVRSEC